MNEALKLAEEKEDAAYATVEQLEEDFLDAVPYCTDSKRDWATRYLAAVTELADAEREVERLKHERSVEITRAIDDSNTPH